ncbi:hypothetical protein U1Q18_016945 [Sarracenia purpurea var. burkii]
MLDSPSDCDLPVCMADLVELGSGFCPVWLWVLPIAVSPMIGLGVAGFVSSGYLSMGARNEICNLASGLGLWVGLRGALVPPGARRVLLPRLISSQTCRRTCGNQPINYPFGTGPGCGDPRFQTSVTCNQNQNQLIFSTHSGCYPITSIDYKNQVLYITDPSMSTCSSTHPSNGFSLDWDAPFTFHDGDLFALLDCSPTSSPLYAGNKPSAFAAAGPLCDTSSAAVCSLLYSCEAVSRLGTPVATCCVYTPVDLGPAFEMDLKKLQCSSYAGIYGFDGKNGDPEKWQYGVALKYKFSFGDDYPTVCEECEKSNGACGYSEAYNSFVCNCPNGMNTTTDCFYPASWSYGLLLLPWRTGSRTLFSFPLR